MLKYILIGTTTILAFFSWQSINTAIQASGSSEWVVPIILFSFFFISLYLSMILIKEIHTIEVLVLFSLSFGFIFTFSFWHLLVIFLVFAISNIGIYKIKRDLKLNIKISLSKTITTGKQFIILGIALLISGQYFLTVKDKDFQYIIPQIQSSRTFDIFTSRVLKMINPDFKNLGNHDLTVDDFIIETQKKQLEKGNFNAVSGDKIDEAITSQLGGNVSPEIKEKVKKEAEEKLNDINSQLLENNQKIILEESRKNLSLIAGKDLTGQEKISEIFPQMINKKIADYFHPKMGQKNSLPLLPAVISILLFLTILPAASFLNIFWTLICQLIFWILVKTKAVVITTVPKEVEIIE